MAPTKMNLKIRARELRLNMTDAENLVWSRVRRKQLKGLQFYRQKVIGNYIVDFYCSKAKLAVEIDGGQHFSESGINKDIKRDQYLNTLGIRVLRFSNHDVLKKIDSVVEHIYNNL